jgi:lipopolysaccharide transport system permease protein
MTSESTPHIVIKPQSGWRLIDFKELKEYRDLAYFLVWRDVTVHHAQTILGFAWAIMQPLIQILLFSVIFGKVAKVATDGIPYTLFSSAAIIPWAYMSAVMIQSSQSLVTNQNMLGKVYFPRLLFPLVPVFSKLVNFAISLLLLAAIMVYYRVAPTWNLLYAPLFILVMMMVPAGIGLWLSALAIRYRDVKFALHYIIQMLMYTAPIVYSASRIPDTYRFLYSLNPIVSVVEGMRAALLGTELQWMFVLPGMVVALLMVIGGAFYFRKMERVFVDVI